MVRLSFRSNEQVSFSIKHWQRWFFFNVLNWALLKSMFNQSFIHRLCWCISTFIDAWPPTVVDQQDNMKLAAGMCYRFTCMLVHVYNTSKAKTHLSKTLHHSTISHRIPLKRFSDINAVFYSCPKDNCMRHPTCMKKRKNAKPRLLCK